MKTKRRFKFKDMPQDFRSLVMMFMPRAIHDEVDYENTIEILDEIVGHDLTDDQEIYLDTLTTLVEAYEKEHHAYEIAKLPPLDALKFLMEENGITAADLGTLLGDRTTASRILRGQKKIGLPQAKILSKRFCLSLDAFIE